MSADRVTEFAAERERLYGKRERFPDPRDLPVLVSDDVVATLPPALDLRDSVLDGADWPAWSQGGLLSCSTQAVCAAWWLMRMKDRPDDVIEPSRMFVYHHARLIEEDGALDENTTTYMRTGLRVLDKIGTVPESQFPTHTDRLGALPSPELTAAAAAYSGIEYRRLGKHETPYDFATVLKACLAEGYAFTLGYRQFDAHDAAADAADDAGPGDLLLLPTTDARTVGAHAVVVVGYDDATERFTFRNSSGPSWGNAGYGTIPYAYATDPAMSSARWTIRPKTS